MVCRFWNFLAAAIVLAGCATPSSTTSSAVQFSFAIIGDLAYAPDSEPQLERVLNDINGTPLSFVVHLGDLAFPRRACYDDLRAKRLAQFQASAHPMIFTPGDNDWTDCHEGQRVQGHEPEERLSNLRQMFFKGPQYFRYASFCPGAAER